MFTAEQYRAKAVEYASYVKTAQSPSEVREFQNLERVYRSLAENAEWLASDFEQTMPAMVHDLNEGTALAKEEEQMLGCLGAAVMMRRDTLPTKIQRELFECATSIGDLRQTAPIKGQLARFLHVRKKDRQQPTRLSPVRIARISNPRGGWDAQLRRRSGWRPWRLPVAPCARGRWSSSS